MRQHKIKLVGMVVCAGLFLTPSIARASMFKSVIIGLSEAGFNFVGEKNLLSGGADLIVSRQFNGERLDFGATELVLNGTPTFTLTTGGRGLEVLDVSLNTANAPLSYVLTTDTGNQQTTINGSLFLDATASVNSFGFYDLQLDVSSRQTIIQDGLLDDSTREEDFDIGPINLRGNLYADLLATITDPIFDLLGIDNIFAQFSGAGMFEEQLATQLNAVLGDTALAKVQTTEELGAYFPDFSGVNATGLGSQSQGVGGVSSLVAIPEPASLVLLSVVAPLILRRRR